MAVGWNLIGYSSEDVNLSVADIKFTNSTGTEFTWASGLANNTFQAYLAYYDSSATNASQRKYKYTTSLSGFDDTKLRKDRGYWLLANQAGNLSLPSVGGSLATETYNWDKLRFRNGSGSEMNVSDAGSKGWVNNVLQTWNQTGTDYFGNPTYDFIEVATGRDVEILESWRGYFIYSNQDNITIIRQN